MMLLAKAALGIGGTLVAAGAYTFHQGLLRIDVDEHRSGRSHVHMWVPAAAVPMAMHLVPTKHMRYASEEARDALPLVHAIVKELKRYPNADLIEVIDHEKHMQMRTREGKLQIDVEAPDQTVHVLCPLPTIEDVTSQLEDHAPGA
jgi:hypothetical protein